MTTPDPALARAVVTEHRYTWGAGVCACGIEVGYIAHRIHLTEVLEPLIRERVAEGLDLRVEVTERLNQPTTCKVWRHGVLVFDGLDRAASIREGGE